MLNRGQSTCPLCLCIILKQRREKTTRAVAALVENLIHIRCGNYCRSANDWRITSEIHYTIQHIILHITSTADRLSIQTHTVTYTASSILKQCCNNVATMMTKRRSDKWNMQWRRGQWSTEHHQSDRNIPAGRRSSASDSARGQQCASVRSRPDGGQHWRMTSSWCCCCCSWHG